MSGGYHPWSKFNAHRWSDLNARRQILDKFRRFGLRTNGYRIFIGYLPISYPVFLADPSCHLLIPIA